MFSVHKSPSSQSAGTVGVNSHFPRAMIHVSKVHLSLSSQSVSALQDSVGCIESEGWSEGANDGTDESDGIMEGCCDSEGSIVGRVDGSCDIEGRSLGIKEGSCDTEGSVVGRVDGSCDMEGWSLGTMEG